MAEKHLPDYCASCNQRLGDHEAVAIQYDYNHPDHYDGVSEWLHLTCGRREGRWSHRQLHEEETEARYGGTG